MKSFLPTLIGLMALAGVGFAAARALILRAAPSAGAGAPAARPVTVEIATLELQDTVLLERTFTGIVTARRDAELGFEGTGRVAEVLVDEGQRVALGQPLARLDTEVLLSRRGEIASRRARLQAQLDELLAGPRAEVVEAARADVRALEEQLELAVLQRDRRAGLAGDGTIGVEQLDAARTTVDTTGARLSAARARLAELENGSRPEQIAAQRGALGEVEASLAALDVQIAKTELRAPFDGVVAARLLDEGALVSQQMPRVAFRLVEADALEARVGLPPGVADRVAAGDLEPRLTARGAPVAASGVRLLPTLDPATRTVTAVFDLSASEAPGPAAARDGDILTLEVTLPEATRGAWVPLAALSESTRGLWSLYRVVPPREGADAPSVRRLELEVLHVAEGRAFVRGTFEGGEPYVRSGAHRLVPHQLVRPVSASLGAGAEVR